MAKDPYLDSAVVKLVEMFVTQSKLVAGDPLPEPEFPLTSATAIQYARSQKWKNRFDACTLDAKRKALCVTVIKDWFDGEADNNPPADDEPKRRARFVNASDAVRTLISALPR